MTKYNLPNIPQKKKRSRYLLEISFFSLFFWDQYSLTTADDVVFSLSFLAIKPAGAVCLWYEDPHVCPIRAITSVDFSKTTTSPIGCQNSTRETHSGLLVRSYAVSCSLSLSICSLSPPCCAFDICTHMSTCGAMCVCVFVCECMSVYM